MKFGIRECANIVFRSKQEVKIGDQIFHEGQPVLYLDTAKTSTIEQAAETTYAQGGRGNSRLIAWEGDKTLTFTVEDALLSPIGFSILSGAGLFKSEAGSEGKVHYHMTTMAAMSATGEIKLEDAVAEFGKKGDGTYKGVICVDDAPLFVLGIEDDGSLSGKVYDGPATLDGTTLTVGGVTESANVMVDYYIDLPGENVYEADITPDTFAGYYYVEADTLFRRQADGKDLPANLTFPNVKLQSNFSIAMAGTGDPSTFTFTFDAFPGYTYFDKTKKVLCVLQIVDDRDATVTGKPVMPHNDNIEFENTNANDSVTTNNKKKASTPGDNTTVTP